jgi:5'-nucleotidase
MANLESDLKDLFSDGADQVQVVADFDGTLTKEYFEGKPTPSLISVLRDQPGYLSPEYQAAAHQLATQYKPFERDAALDLPTRKEKMTEWWVKHKQLLIASGIKREHLQQLAQSKFIQWRPGATEFLGLMKKLNIPVVILSASGIGEVIEIYCQAQNVDSSNMHYLVNKFVWDKEGHAVGFHQPVIHSLNKDETAVQSHAEVAAAGAARRAAIEVAAAIKDRVNMLLLGNSIGDLGMSNGFTGQKKLTIGFLDEEERDRLPEFKKAFDHVIVGSGYSSINQAILEKLISTA